jgi:hypothetical protein
MNRLVSHPVTLLVGAVLAVAAIVALRASIAPVELRPSAEPSVWTAPAPPSSGLYERIQLSMAAATSRNDQALAFCESEINAVLAREFAEIARKGDAAAAEVSTYSSCCGIIYRLAKDKVFGGSNAADYVDAELGGRLRPTLHACARDIDTALARFDRSLAESTVMLASELAQIRGSTGSQPLDVTVEVGTAGDLDKALRNLGFSAASIGVGGALDAWALLQSRLLNGMLTKATGMATSMFARPATAAAAEMTAAAADGPLPIGDVIAIVGGLWTAYDIYATRAEFERELRTSLANALPDMKRSVHDQLIARIRGTLDAHRRVQDAIRTASTESITR